MKNWLSSLLLLSETILAAPVVNQCTTFNVSVSVQNATQVVPQFAYPFPDDGYAATSFANALTVRDPPQTRPILRPFNGSFSINVQYCTPNGTNDKQTIQFLTHGIGFDRGYWDFRLPSRPNDSQYSYIATALKNGYSTLAWSRPGTGLSSVPDPYTVVQAPIELAVLTQLTKMLRNGELGYYGVVTPRKVIHVGHSFGSELTNALGALPEANQLTDGIILTGFSGTFNYTAESTAAFSFHLAKTNQPARFANRSSGYVTWADKFNNQYAFLAWPYFEPVVLEYSEITKWPPTIGEFFTMPTLNFKAQTFTGPVLWLASQFDNIFCGGNCVGLYGPGSPALTSFTASKDVQVYIQPNVGHGLNLHLNATGAYNVAQAWAISHGF